MTVSELVRHTTLELKNVSGDDASFEAKSLVSFTTGIPFHRISLSRDVPVEADIAAKINELIDRRKHHEPLQYILGDWEFFGLSFLVSPGVLIPRQDTEILVETAIDIIRKKHCSSVLDLCCGSGCIGISIANATGIDISFSDISCVCIELAKKNAQRNGVSGTYYCGDLFVPLDKTFDMICINPPYLTDPDMRNLQPELKYEPSLALYGGPDGLDYYRRIASEYKQYLSEGGTLLLEIGCDEGNAVLKMFEHAELILDLNNKPRLIKVENI